MTGEEEDGFSSNREIFTLFPGQSGNGEAATGSVKVLWGLTLECTFGGQKQLGEERDDSEREPGGKN
ncbi:hypothetical protein STEG23_031975 [Scotinomys teguina]